MIAARKAFLRFDALVARAEAAVVALLMAGLTAVTAAQVFNRYVLNEPLIWSEEAARYLFVWVSMIGAALAMHEGGHFGLVVLLRRGSPRLQAVLGGAVTVVVIVFLAVFLVTGIREAALASLQTALTIPISMEWPYLALPISAGLMLLHVAAHLVRFGRGMHLLSATQHVEAHME